MANVGENFKFLSFTLTVGVGGMCSPLKNIVYCSQYSEKSCYAVVRQNDAVHSRALLEF